jgi:hypothetical protein
MTRYLWSRRIYIMNGADVFTYGADVLEEYFDSPKLQTDQARCLFLTEWVSFESTPVGHRI